jgi:hypothetical protein
VVNLLTGYRKEMIPTFATHAHLRAIGGVVSPEERQLIEAGAADSVKRVRSSRPRNEDRLAEWGGAIAVTLRHSGLVEFKTTWHPVGA